MNLRAASNLAPRSLGEQSSFGLAMTVKFRYLICSRKELIVGCEALKIKNKEANSFCFTQVKDRNGAFSASMALRNP